MSISSDFLLCLWRDCYEYSFETVCDDVNFVSLLRRPAVTVYSVVIQFVTILAQAWYTCRVTYFISVFVTASTCNF